jgi:hypothetical protein
MVQKKEQKEITTHFTRIEDMIQDIVVALLNIGGSSTHPNPKPISQLVTIVGT